MCATVHAGMYACMHAYMNICMCQNIHTATFKHFTKTQMFPKNTIQNRLYQVTLDYNRFRLTVVRRSRATNLSSCVAADLSKASCFLSSISTASSVSPKSGLLTYGSCAASHASATEASRAN